MDQIASLSFLLPPLLLMLSVFAIRQTSNLKSLIQLAEYILFSSALIAVTVLGLLYVDQIQTVTFGVRDIGLLFRVDALSAAMLFMVSIIGFVVVRFSWSYLLGDPNHLIFIRRLLLTIILVQLLMISGSLVSLAVFWVATSIALHYLLIFYKERKTARDSARKKFLVARISDAALISASILLYVELKTVDLGVIFEQLQTAEASLNLTSAIVLIVVAAVFKSAQVPFHGWLLEVMEAPTPVSGLLHAGLLNAGPFLIIRFAYLMDLSSVGSTMLIIIGGVTALYGTIVFPSQPAIKTALAYSSVAHMGFSLMTCGFGLYSAALLHLMAHSFYKAHSFLSSGSSVDHYRLYKLRKHHQKQVNLLNILLGIIITSVLYIGFAQLWGGFLNQSVQMYLLGGIIVTGVSIYTINSMGYSSAVAMLFSCVLGSSVVLLSFFFLEHFFDDLVGDAIPEISTLTTVQLYTSIVILALFVGIGLASVLENTKNSAISKWQIYRRNGFYLQHFLDKLIDGKDLKILK